MAGLVTCVKLETRQQLVESRSIAAAGIRTETVWLEE